MPTRYTIVCEDELTNRVEQLAYENGLTEEAVLRQLIDIGLETTLERRSEL